MALVVVGLRLLVAANGDVGRFVVAGDVFVDADAVERETGATLHVFPSPGYDGQFYWRLAVDPAAWETAEHDGVTFDSAYRPPRIGYPVLAFVVSGGGAARVAAALVAVNVAAVGLAGWAAALLARSGGHAPAWGLALVAATGLVMGVGRALAEPVTVACLVGGLAALVHRRPLVAAAAWSMAVLTREQALVTVAGYALWRLGTAAACRRRPSTAGPSGAGSAPAVAHPPAARPAVTEATPSPPTATLTAPANPPGATTEATPSPPGAASPEAAIAAGPHRWVDDVAWVVPGAVAVGWQLVLWRRLGELPAAAAGGTNVVPPFTALVPGVARWATGDLPRLHVVAPLQLAVLVAVVVAAVRSASRVPAADRHVVVALGLASLAATCLAASIWRDPSDLRHLVDVWVLAWAVLLLADRPPPRWAAVAAGVVWAATAALRVVAI